MKAVIVWIVLILSTGPLQVQSISKVMRNTIRNQAEQQNRWKERQELAEARTKRTEIGETLSYTELRDIISSHLQSHSQTPASGTDDEDVLMVQCDGRGSEWV